MGGRNIKVLPINFPVIVRAVSANGVNAPVVWGDKQLILSGSSLVGEKTLVKIGDVKITPDNQLIDPLEIRIPLNNETLLAGKQEVQVIHKVWIAERPAQENGLGWRAGSVSNKIKVKLRPTINGDIQVKNVAKVNNNGTLSADLQVTVSPKISKDQEVRLFLNEIAEDQPESYTFTRSSEKEDTNTAKFKVNNVKPGEYLVRVMVDKAESVLIASDNTGVYSAPKVIIPEAVTKKTGK